MNETEATEHIRLESDPPDALASESIPDTSADVESSSGGASKAAEPDMVNAMPTQTVPFTGKSAPHGIVGWVLGLAVFALAAANYMHINELRSAGSRRVVTVTKNEPKSSAVTSRLDAMQSNLDRLQKSVNELLLANTEEPFPEIKTTSDAVGTSGQLDELKSAIGQLQELVSGLYEDATTEPETEMESVTLDELETDVKSSVESIVELARTFEESGDHERAGYYWRNAVEHASDKELLPVLKEYAGAVFKVESTDESGFAEAAMLERLAELALVRVSPEQINEALEFRAKCADFHQRLLANANSVFEEELDAEDAPTPDRESLPTTIANSVEKLLGEITQSIAAYQPNTDNERPSTAECKILQLLGVAENAMSQLWFLDRDDLDAVEKERIDEFPGRLTKLIDDFNAKHDKPLLEKIQRLTTDKPPKTSHQANIEFFTKQAEQATANSRKLRGTDAQTKAQESISAILKNIASSKRQQMNEYQKFAANCCRLAYDTKNKIESGMFEDSGSIPKKKGYSNVDQFIENKVRSYSRQISPSVLSTSKDGQSVYADDNLIAGALSTKSPSGDRIKVSNAKKAFIALAVYGFFRVDQSLLLPESSRLFNDTFREYYECLDESDKIKSVRWTIEEPKIRLEDF